MQLMAQRLARAALDREPVQETGLRGKLRDLGTVLGLGREGEATPKDVAMRALAHPDVFLPTDIGVRNALRGLGHDPAEVIARAGDWSPWRSYALLHLWNTLMPPTKEH